ncbi:MAG: L,D-transpeptidase [Verrucomicrobiales bacterium]|nr:L,D-transpeptidase [Verrucomicrobiales bacterium]
MKRTKSLHAATGIRIRAGFAALLLSGVAALLSSCSSVSTAGREVRVSVKDQKVALLQNGKPVRVYQCSTSKFGVGDNPGSYATPLGKLRVAQKIGRGARPGTVFKSRRPTGEVLPPDAPGRDPIVTRILWLAGCESKNRRAFGRCIYIHGTPEERNIGRPMSWGCVRMRSMDIVDLFDKVPVGTPVTVTKSGLPGEVRKQPVYAASWPSRSMPKVQQPMLPPSSGRTVKQIAATGAPKLGPEVAMSDRTKSKKSRR